jgi:hypothetical protein
MSRLRRADYTQPLAGKTLKRVHWNNEEEWKCLTLEFTDQTLCSFRFELMVDEDSLAAISRMTGSLFQCLWLASL